MEAWFLIESDIYGENKSNSQAKRIGLREEAIKDQESSKRSDLFFLTKLCLG